MLSRNNSKIFKEISNEYGSFYNYLKEFTKDETIYETDKTTNDLSDTISKDLQNRGMTFVGSVIIYSYLMTLVTNCQEIFSTFYLVSLPFYDRFFALFPCSVSEI